MIKKKISPYGEFFCPKLFILNVILLEVQNKYKNRMRR